MTPFEEQQAELRKVDRDLSFSPADPAAAKTLTPEQVTFFNNNGYLPALPIFDSDHGSGRGCMLWHTNEAASLSDYLSL